MFVHRGVTPLSERGLRPSRRSAMRRNDATIPTCDKGVVHPTVKFDAEKASSHHAGDSCGIPNSLVVAMLCNQLDENWAATLSYETLIQPGWPQNNLFVQMPRPEDAKRKSGAGSGPATLRCTQRRHQRSASVGPALCRPKSLPRQKAVTERDS